MTNDLHTLRSLIDNYGGTVKQSSDTQLLNKYQSYAPDNPDAQIYNQAVSDALWKNTLKLINK